MVYTKEQIQQMLTTNDRAVIRGILAIFNNQTSDEKQSEQTRLNNGIGFNGADAPIMSSFAKQIQQNRPLTDRQMEIARRRMLKYAGQLTMIANSNSR